GFWQAELARAGCDAPHPFACTVRLARRLYPEAPNHQLGTLARFHQLPSAGRAHRALADAQVTAALLLRIQQDLAERWGVADAGHDFLMALQACAKTQLPTFLHKHGAAAWPQPTRYAAR
ncbi:MAG TPA: DNA polymerase III subunit epsilon, partial [Comamonadaceae bacterium]|nr:DNA polymerase III subunit epsilon [Comamonadaceae bacterium]